jgi:hypothetical protein
MLFFALRVRAKIDLLGIKIICLELGVQTVVSVS